MSEKGVLRKVILGFKREELIRECRRLHNEKLYDIFFSRGHPVVLSIILK
jgi:hypothetical protein